MNNYHIWTYSLYKHQRQQALSALATALYETLRYDDTSPLYKRVIFKQNEAASKIQAVITGKEARDAVGMEACVKPVEGSLYGEATVDYTIVSGSELGIIIAESKVAITPRVPSTMR